MRFMLAIGLSCLFAGSLAAQAAVLIPVSPVSGSTRTDVYGINDSNTLVGDYYTADGNEHGFFGPLNGAYTTFDYTGVPYTEGHGINNGGYITGMAYNSDGFTIQFAGGQIQQGGYIQGINSKGVFVGDYINSDGLFAYYGKKGKYRSALTLPDGNLPRPHGINDSGIVVGTTYIAGVAHGFLLNGDTDALVDYPDPHATSTALTGINKSGIAVGSWCSGASCNRLHAFRFDMTSGSFSPIKVPHAQNVSAWAINAAGFVVINVDGQDYLYCPYSKKSGKCPAGGVEMSDGARAPVAPAR
jgi:hypothetical protein